tara:strand:+ start:261 stop:611 length:351 start_codon:yes stop_codon:yes gene_type:complete
VLNLIGYFLGLLLVQGSLLLLVIPISQKVINKFEINSRNLLAGTSIGIGLVFSWVAFSIALMRKEMVGKIKMIFITKNLFFGHSSFPAINPFYELINAELLSINQMENKCTKTRAN